MSPLRHTVAILVVVAIFTSAAGVPRPEEAKKEADNIIPQKSEAITLKTTTHVTSPSSPSKVHITRAPPTASTISSGFSKFINDVFQIPISVLKAVSTFLSNSLGNAQLGQRKTKSATLKDWD